DIWSDLIRIDPHLFDDDFDDSSCNIVHVVSIRLNNEMDADPPGSKFHGSQARPAMLSIRIRSSSVEMPSEVTRTSGISQPACLDGKACYPPDGHLRGFILKLPVAM
ncbi:MAG: hypothetical protein WBL20_01030, partial [Sphingobium sp.]